MKTTLKITTTAMVFGALTIGCAKKREAALADSDAQSIYSVSDFGDLEGQKTSFSFRTASEPKKLNEAQSAQAINENGTFAVDESGLNVPARLKGMFRALEISAEGGREYKVVFVVGKDVVTAYRSVSDTEKLSVLDTVLVSTTEKLSAEVAFQKVANATNIKRLQTANQNVVQMVETKSGSARWVPIFKYKLDDMGIIQTKRNDAGDETSTLELKKTDLAGATHVKIASLDIAKRLNVAGEEKDLKDLFIASKLNKVITAAALKSDFGLPTTLANDVKIQLSLTETELVVSQGEGEKATRVYGVPVKYVAAKAVMMNDQSRATTLAIEDVTQEISQKGGQDLVKIVRTKEMTAAASAAQVGAK